MSDNFQVDSSQLLRHANNVRSVSDQLAAIRSASSAISQDDSAYGLLCGWISAILERRHAGQDDLYSYVGENLRLLADALDATAHEYDAVDENAKSDIGVAGGLS